MPQSLPRSFERDGHLIIWGDALEVLENNVEDSSIDLIFADPPYSIGKRFGNFIDSWPSEASYVSWCREWLDLCIRKLKPFGSFYVMSSTQAMPQLDVYLRDRICIKSRIVWHYDSSGVQARKHFGSMYEPILYCVKDKGRYTFNAEEIMVEARTGSQRKLIDYRKATPAVYGSRKVPGNAWYFARVRYQMPEYEVHPSQKPEALLERIIGASSNPGDVVLDPFSGSFTTSTVARRLGRKSIGIETQREYIEVGLRRCGISGQLDGKVLVKPEKTRRHRNANGKHAVEGPRSPAMNLGD